MTPYGFPSDRATYTHRELLSSLEEAIHTRSPTGKVEAGVVLDYGGNVLYVEAAHGVGGFDWFNYSLLLLLSIAIWSRIEVHRLLCSQAHSAGAIEDPQWMKRRLFSSTLDDHLPVGRKTQRTSETVRTPAFFFDNASSSPLLRCDVSHKGLG